MMNANWYRYLTYVRENHRLPLLNGKQQTFKCKLYFTVFRKLLEIPFGSCYSPFDGDAWHDFKKVSCESVTRVQVEVASWRRSRRIYPTLNHLGLVPSRNSNS